MKRLLGFLKPHRRLFIMLVVLNTAMAGLAVVNPLLSKRIVDQVILGRRYQILPRFIAVILIVAGLRSIGMFFYQFGKETLGQRILTTVRTAMYRKFLVLPFSFYDTAQTGQLMSRITNDVDTTRLFLANALVEAINLFVTVIWVYSSFALQNLALALWCGLPLAVLAAAVNILQRRLSPVWNQVHQQNAELSAVLQENLAGYQVVKAFAREEDEEARFRAVNEKTMRLNYRVAKMWTGIQGVMNFSSRGIQLAVLGFGGYLVAKGRMSLGALVASFSLVRMLIGPLVQLGNQLNIFSQSLAGSLRIFQVLDEPCPIRSPRRPEALPEVRGALEFQNVTFAYKGEIKHALHQVSLSIPAGASLGVVGETGSGKSTLINLLGRFYEPAAGEIRLDGHNIARLDLELLRRNLGYVSQEPLLFSATIKENIAFGNPNAPFDDIIGAARLAQAHEFIMELPEGYETRLGERGAGLSGGQKQRLAIARAFLTNPRILILDDCTSAVDAETEALLREAIRRVMQGRTTIIVSNRISAVQEARQIVVLHEGRIVERGAHEELLAAKGRYWRSYQLQVLNLEDRC